MFAISEPWIPEDTFRAGGFHNVAVHAVRTRWRFPSTAEAIQATKNSFPGLQRIMAPLSDAERELV
jgi:hypothetical protein